VTPSRYDDELWELVPEEPGPPPAHIEAFVRGLGTVASALDLGCGDGRLTAALGAQSLTMADVSAVALARARARVPGARAVELTPDEPLPFADGEFELVLCTETIEHVRDVQLLLSEVRRVLMPGGRLGVTTPAHGRGTAIELLLRGFESEFDPLSPHLRFFTAKSLRRVLGALGFSVASLRSESGSLLAVAER
jgi:ubiquinone/menaquinone biosynthesis C-methylase UbiE